MSNDIFFILHYIYFSKHINPEIQKNKDTFCILDYFPPEAPFFSMPVTNPPIAYAHTITTPKITRSTSSVVWSVTSVISSHNEDIFTAMIFYSPIY